MNGTKQSGLGDVLQSSRMESTLANVFLFCRSVGQKLRTRSRRVGEKKVAHSVIEPEGR